MRVHVFFIVFIALFLGSCSSSKKVNSNNKSASKAVEPKPQKLPSVGEHQHIRKLERKKANLNNHTLHYIRKYAPLAVLEMHEYKIPASITLAQGILESGNGRSQLASKSFLPYLTF